MSNEQKGILIVSNENTCKQLEREFTVTLELAKGLAVSDVEYMYLVEQGRNGGYFLGHLGKIRKITIDSSSTPLNKIYSFEMSQFVRPSNVVSKVRFMADDKKNGDTFDCDFDQIFIDANESDDPWIKACENHLGLGNRPLSINEAIGRIADTYGIDSGKVSISITG